MAKLPRWLKFKKLSARERRTWTKALLVLTAVLIFLAGSGAGIAFQERRSGLNLTKFWQTYNLIQQKYVGQVDPNAEAEGAVKGLVSSLGDPFSSYLTAQDKSSLDAELSGQFQGIGAELTEKNQLITVVASLKGSPAEKAGLQANDVIVKIDGTSTQNMSVDDAVNMIRGPKGSPVTLTVARNGNDSPLELKITRDEITVPSVEWKMMNDIGYINLTQFGNDTVPLFEQAIKEISANNPKAIVLDLRDDPGGYLNDVPTIAGQFLPPSVVVKEKYRDGKIDQLRSSDTPVLPTTPLYVLVNGGSASAAEILAGALQDYKRATIVGQKTFGKGSVQELIPLGDKSALRLTIAEWLTPTGRTINKVGITPDVVVTDIKTASNDPILDKALSLINK